MAGYKLCGDISTKHAIMYMVYYNPESLTNL